MRELSPYALDMLSKTMAEEARRAADPAICNVPCEGWPGSRNLRCGLASGHDGPHKNSENGCIAWTDEQEWKRR